LKDRNNRLFTEDHSWAERQSSDQSISQGHEDNRISRMGPFWDFLHIFGAFSYVACVTGAVLWNSFDVEVAIITCVTFFCFSFLGWLTGVFDHVRCFLISKRVNTVLFFFF
jgi:hypothetical protein